ncbi:phosphotransferase [Pseudoxanthobacter sp.]|uniref:aminoglycoside phosphotransferase family protein n=1 Tax=Pseudoxanthobacter sp. TaxID=1925742 RepID=UPI002FE20A4B
MTAAGDLRAAERQRFAEEAGFGGALVALPSDASPRRYFRLPGALLMDAGAGAADFPPFLAIAAHLKRLGLSAPAILAADAARGLAVIEDFGADTFTRLLAAGRAEAPLYELAVDALAALHTAPQATGIAVPAYDLGPLREELEMFTGWFVPAVAPGLDAGAFADRFLGLWQQKLAGVATVREALVLRDYHVDNLMVVAGRSGVAACGLLDFQDALLGSAAYDLVSLTQDARRDLTPGLEPALVSRYLAARPDLDPAAFTAGYWLLAAHRHTKIAGNFERLSKRDGKHGYLVHIPRVLRLLDRALGEAGLTDIRALMDAHLPGWRRHAPAAPAA